MNPLLFIITSVLLEMHETVTFVPIKNLFLFRYTPGVWCSSMIKECPASRYLR